MKRGRLYRSIFLMLWMFSIFAAWGMKETMANGQGYYSPNAKPPTSVQNGGTNDSGVVHGGKAWGGLTVGYTGSNKIIRDSSVVTIPRLGSSKYGLVETNVTIKRQDTNGNIFQTLEGKALVFANESETADAGYLFVSPAEAQAWVAVLNGNPSFVFSSRSNVNQYEIIELNTGVAFTAYNLAEIANASGAGGDRPPGDGLTRIRNDLYLKRDGFIATPRPTAVINELQPTYEIGDRISITGYADAYSVYDRRVVVENFTVQNVTTNTQYTQIEPSPGQKSAHWDSNKNFIFVPQAEGTYEVNLWVKDYHQREATEYPVKRTFIVGNPDPEPEPEPEPEPGPACSVDTSRTTMTFQVVGDEDVKNYTNIPSGGSAIPVEPYAEISLRAAKEGDFWIGGIKLEPYQKDRTRGIGYFGGSGTFTVTYKSDDGRDCWEKTFRVDSGNDDREDSCPRFEVFVSTWDYMSSGKTVYLMPQQEIRFRAEYYNENGEKDEASVLWVVTKPDGTTDTSGSFNEDDRWRSGPTRTFELPRWVNGKPGSRLHKNDIPLEPGKTYHVRISYEDTKWEERTDCKGWEITVIVKDVACTIEEQDRIAFTRYGSPSPPSKYPPVGERVNTRVTGWEHISQYTRLPDGSYDTNTEYAADVAGTWYLNYDGERIALTGQLAANERFRLILPEYVGAGDTILLEFISDTGCIRTITFQILSDNKCDKTLMGANLILATKYPEEIFWEYEVSFGQTIYLSAEDARDKGKYRVLLQTGGMKSDYTLYWFDPETQDWERERNGKRLHSGENDHSHTVLFPDDPDTGIPLEGLYRISVSDDEADDSSGEGRECTGSFYVQIGEAGDVENLLIIKDSFSITPDDPQLPGTEATITFEIKNAGKTEHDTTLAVRWESSPTATMLDVKGFKPGEVRKITIPTLYPQQSEDFIGNINPDKDKPDNESVWPDNRAEWPVEVEKEMPTPPGGGGNFDGGEIGLEIYDSDGRQLQKLDTNADGVWEREPARIRVVIDQTKINEGFARTEQEINANIEDYKARLEEYVSGEGVRNIRVTASPDRIVNAKSLAVYDPASLQVQVTGPGTPQQWSVSSASTGGDYLYTGTTVPTQTTWREVLDARPYVAQINGFVITMDYRVDFTVSYEVCSTDAEEPDTCEENSFVQTMSGRYTITVKGSQRSFEVFEPNATGSIHHTPEWQEYHGRDRYPNSRPDDFYAGERILAQIELQQRHRHPVSGKYPVLEAAVAWISETGRQQTPLQSKLSLQPAGETRWRGPSYQASKLGTREQGVDTPLMGDKQRGFQKDASYAVYYSVQFRFGVTKGFPYANKLTGSGHDMKDYRIPFRIIANAWERQGIRNHSTQ